LKREKPDNQRALEQVFDYHQATKHHFNAYARGPGNLDWANQPNPFRRYQGAQLITLASDLPAGEVRYDDVFVRGQLSPVPVTARSISQLFYDSLTISAWKSTGYSRWALRVNPSSGNLHPTEGYLLCGPVDGLCEQAMVCHYAPQEHALEVRAEVDSELWAGLTAGFPAGTLFIGLTSVHWREEWKYGQRAYRYCQHDVGHAVAAVSMAAAGLGWQATLLDELGANDLALLMGTASHDDAEQEVPDLLLAISPVTFTAGKVALSSEHVQLFASLQWQGVANQLSAAHIDWGVAEVANATHKPPGRIQYEAYDIHQVEPSIFDKADVRPCLLRNIIQQRRSAVAMDGRTRISRKTFFHMLARTVALSSPPLNVLPWQPKIHLVLFVHRVDDLPAGLYILVRDPVQLNSLKSALTQVDEWQQAEGCPEQLALYCLFETDVQEASRQISCFQDIASDGCFSLAMIAAYQTPLQHYGPWFYPRLFWEAGMIGQILYLEAEAAGIRSTGIGCFFDDAMHDVLGLKDREYQDLYHFTVGGPVEDVRLR
jgi:SagB-type dehydrogenase family enzyme